VFPAQGEEGLGLEELSIECLAPNGMIYQVPSADKAFIKKHFIDGDFVSGETDMVFEESILTNIFKSEPVLHSAPTLIKKKYSVKGGSGKGRKLAVTGNFSVLAIRIKLADGETSALEEDIRDGIFGTDGDVVNLKTQYSNCSHGQLNFDPVEYLEGDTLNIDNGVITVNLPDKVKSDGNVSIRNAINSILYSEFGKSPWSREIADHVMYCMPPDVMSRIAFAGVNSWYSVYSDEWCHQYSAVQLHEIGHNLGLGHSGEGDIDQGNNQYQDRTGNMGFSYREDDTYMCFNSAKSWQLGWYSTSAITIDAILLRVYEGDVAGVIEDPFTVDVPQVIKLNTPIGDDYFLNFNRKFSFNSGTKEGANQVMITKQAGEGNNYSPSILLAKLSAGGSWTSDPVFIGESVTVTVNSIGTRANIKICVGTCPTTTDSPSKSPSALPVASTGAPSSVPSVFPSASPVASTGAPSSAPSVFPSASPVASTGAPSSVPSVSPSASPVESTGAPSSVPSVSPSASPVESTGAPSSVPSVSPSISPAAKTGAPSIAPASRSFCIEVTRSKFLLRKKKDGTRVIKKCKYLQKLKEEGEDEKVQKACKETESTKNKKPAKDVCQVTCETCPSTCVELESAKAYFKTVDSTKHKTVTCGSLAKKSQNAQDKACKIDVSPIERDVAKVVCPVTCKEC